MDGTKERKKNRLMLANLKEVYAEFRKSHLNIVIGFSSFGSLRHHGVF